MGEYLPSNKLNKFITHGDSIRCGGLALIRSLTLGICAAFLLLSCTAALLAQAEQAFIAPGKIRSWDDLPKVSVSPEVKKEETIPLGYELPLEELRRLKSQTFIPKREWLFAAERDLSAFGPQLQPLAPNLLIGFDALDNLSNATLNNGIISRPADPNIAAGPNHVGVVVNTVLAFYTKTGTLARQASFREWFSNVDPPPQMFDPRIVYDHNEGRWMILILAIDRDAQQSFYLLSVSMTSDPLGPWRNFILDGSFVFPPTGENTWADYPDLGFDGIPSSLGGAIYITSNQFTFSDNRFRTPMLNILPKSTFYTGSGPSSYWRVPDMKNEDGSPAFTLRTAHTFGNPGGEFLVNSKSEGWNRVTLWRVIPAFPPTPPNITRMATVPVRAYSMPPDARQPGCTSLLDTGDNRIYNAMFRNGFLYCAFTEAANFGGGTVAAIRYLKINTSTGAATLDVTFGADGFYYFYPAIYTDSSDNIVIVFARSSPTEFASIYYTGRLTTDAATQPSAQLKAGELCITGEKWGDYFGIASDPSDGGRVWIYGQWAKNLPGIDSDWDWGTWVGAVRFQAQQPPSLSVSPTFFSFSANQGGSNPPAQQLRITNSGGGFLSWSVSDDAPWLTVRRNMPGQETSGVEGPGQTSTPPLDVSVNIAGLSAGTYRANISVTSNGGNANIPVTLAITAVTGPPRLLVGTYSFSARRGGPNPPAQTLSISNDGGQNLVWNVSTNVPWLIVRRNLPGQETSGVEGPGQTATPPPTVQVNIQGLDQGTYIGAIFITSNDVNVRIGVILNISP